MPLHIQGSTDIADDAWHHVALTYDGKVIALYVDGKKEHELTPQSPLAKNDHDLWIGGRPEGVAATGIIDEVRFYTRALSAEEEAGQVSTFLMDLFRVSDPGQARGNTITAREILDLGAARIDNELADRPDIQAALTVIGRRPDERIAHERRQRGGGTGGGAGGADGFRLDLRGANLQRADLTGLDLARALLTGTRLEGANLGEARLEGANLHSANLKSADLSNVRAHVQLLRSADFRFAE